MNVTELYERVVSTFGHGRLNVWYYVNPILNHRDYSYIQFIWPFGGSVPPINPNATEMVFADPLEGPFYRLPVVGLEFVEATKEGDPHAVSAIVKLPNGKLSHSCAMFISGDAASIRKELGEMVDNSWYKIDLFAKPVRIIRDEQLVQDSGLQLR